MFATKNEMIRRCLKYNLLSIRKNAYKFKLISGGKDAEVPVGPSHGGVDQSGRVLQFMWSPTRRPATNIKTVMRPNPNKTVAMTGVMA